MRPAIPQRVRYLVRCLARMWLYRRSRHRLPQVAASSGVWQLGRVGRPGCLAWWAWGRTRKAAFWGEHLRGACGRAQSRLSWRVMLRHFRSSREQDRSAVLGTELSPGQL